MNGRLGPDERIASLQALKASTFDVVVIGGGVTGCGVALDAASRGMSVALIEARDFASGTSSRSSKLIHGGLRYLELLDFALVKEALHERGLLTKVLAPHLVQPLPFLLPLHRRVWERAYVGAGLALYDVLARAGRSPRLPWHSHLSKKRAAQIWPSLNPDSYIGALEYYDAQVDDARHTLTLGRTAATFGAKLINRARVVDLLKVRDRVTGVRVKTDEGDEFDVKARVVINASGVWSNDVESLVGGIDHNISVRASKGIHLVVPRDRIDASTGLIARTEKSVLFVIPWGDHWIIGTTDTDWTHDKAHPSASRKDIHYVLDHVNKLVKRPITTDDIQGVYVGLRPLVAPVSSQTGGASTAKLSREHAVSTPAPGLVGITGGKYTTYRIMARDVVDVATPYVVGARDASATDYTVKPSRTHEIPLLGANGFADLVSQADALSKQYGLPVDQITRLLYRYGALIHEVLAPTIDRSELKQLLPGTNEYIAAEALYAVTHESALHVEDVLTRRTRMSVQTWSRGVDAAQTVAALMQEVLGWSDERKASEVAHYTKRVDAERASNLADDDEEADRLRRQAGDITEAV